MPFAVHRIVNNVVYIFRLAIFFSFLRFFFFCFNFHVTITTIDRPWLLLLLCSFFFVKLLHFEKEMHSATSSQHSINGPAQIRAETLIKYTKQTTYKNSFDLCIRLWPILCALKFFFSLRYVSSYLHFFNLKIDFTISHTIFSLRKDFNL